MSATDRTAELSPTALSDQVEALAAILHRASQRVALRADLRYCYRAARQAIEVSTGAWQAVWAKCLAQAGGALGLRVEPLFLTPAELERCLAGRSLLALWREDDGDQGGWLLIDRREHNTLVATNHLGEERRVRPSEVFATENGSQRAEVLFCLIEPLLTCGPADVGQPATSTSLTPGHRYEELVGHSQLTPLRRLIGMLRRDRADLWTVVIFSIVVGVLGLAVPITAELLFSIVAFGNLLQPVLILTVLLGVALTFSAILQAAEIYVVELMQRRLFVRLASDLTVRLRRVDMSVWDEHHGPELVNRFFDILTVQKVGASLLLDGLSLTILAVVSMIVLAFYHPFLLGYDLVLITSIVVGLYVLGRGAVNSAIAESRSKYAVVSWLEEMTRHPLAFKLTGAGDFSWRRSEGLVRDYLANRQFHFRTLFRQISFALALQAIATTMLLGIGGWLVIDRTLTLGQLVAAQLLVSNIVSAGAKLGKHIEGYYDLMAATDKVGHLIDLPLEPHGGMLSELAEGPVDLKVQHVSFAYQPGHPLLNRVELEARPGEAVALRGSAGRGKSALVDLISGLREPLDGRIVIGGNDLRDYDREILRDAVVAVRGVELFEGTIAENVTLDRPHVSRGGMLAALDATCLHAEIAALPDGLRTEITAGGSPLSDSQALRLTLARALAGRPRLLVLDEALDRLSQSLRTEILEGLLRQPRPWTLLIVTNLDDVAERCDRVIDLDATGRHPQ